MRMISRSPLPLLEWYQIECILKSCGMIAQLQIKRYSTSLLRQFLIKILKEETIWAYDRIIIKWWAVEPVRRSCTPAYGIA